MLQYFQPKASVRSVSPLRPITSVELPDPVSSSKNTSCYSRVKEANSNCNRLNKPLDGYRPITPIPSFDILPASIPRIEIDKVTANGFSSQNQYNTTPAFYGYFCLLSICL